MVPTHHISPTSYTSKRRGISPGLSSLQYYTVGQVTTVRPPLFNRLIILGIAVALFFQCMSALLLPVSPTTKGVRWGLVAYSVALFSFLTIGFATNRNIFSMAYIDEREFTGVIPGPLGFIIFPPLDRRAVGYFSFLTFSFVQWLADGLLVSSASNSTVPVLTQHTHSAVPLLCDLCDELLGHCCPIHDVPRFCWYAPESSAN